jgi:hypothetical protein
VWLSVEGSFGGRRSGLRLADWPKILRIYGIKNLIKRLHSLQLELPPSRLGHMNEIAVPNARFKPLTLVAVAISSAAVAILLGASLSPALAAPPVASDGTISACYKVKGKPKGSMRLLVKGKRCKRGERKVKWIAASSGPAGVTGDGNAGAQGTPGTSGQSGGDSSTEAALNAKIAALTLKVDSLEGVLDGVTNGDLTGVVSKLDGVTNSDLTGAVDAVAGLTNAQLLEAVGAVPVLESVCDQAASLTAQSNLLRGEVGDLVTTLSGSLLGAIFGGVSLPPALDPFACATP